MPIKFRCPHCQQFLGISRAKAREITDCPTCGRTIRIPSLDGTVEPLPDPKLNFQDTGLRDALASLASLDEASSDAPDSNAGNVKVESEPFVVENTSQSREVVEPMILEAPAIIEPQLEARAVSPQPGPTTAPDSESNPLSELAAQPTTPATSPKPGRRTKKQGGAILLLGVLLSFFAGMLIGYSIGSASSTTTTTDDQPAAALPAPGPANPPPVAVAANANGHTSVRGSLTYTSANKQTLGDSEARVLAFPEQHPGQVKLPIQGFRAGADPADRHVAEASLLALGGEYTTADKGGRYSLHLAPGTYHLLFISRYSPRDENAQLIDPVRNLATTYFDRPQLLVGQVNYGYVKLTLGSEAQTIDYQFTDQ